MLWTEHMTGTNQQEKQKMNMITVLIIPKQSSGENKKKVHTYIYMKDRRPEKAHLSKLERF